MVTNISIFSFQPGATPHGSWGGSPKRQSRRMFSRRPEPRRSRIRDQFLRWLCWLLAVTGQGLFWLATRLYRGGFLSRKRSWRLIQWSSSLNQSAIRIMRRARW